MHIIGWCSRKRANFHRKYFFDNLFSSIPDITESLVIKMVFRDHFWILSLLLGVMTEDRFEGDEAVVSISIWEIVGITFSGIEILEGMYFWWYCLRTSFIWWSLWTFFFGLVHLVSVLLCFASASIFWECLGGLMCNTKLLQCSDGPRWMLRA